jgi:Ca2+-binding EF-hand superfamily protein
MADGEVEWRVGDEVLVLSKYRGVIKFIGPTGFSAGVWYGLEMDKEVGKHEGTVLGVEYFQAGPKRGTFVKREQLVPFSEQQQASSSIAGLARIGSARKALKAELVVSAFNRLDADDEAQAMQRQAALLNTALGQALQRGRPTEERLEAWAREAAAMAVEAGYAGPALALPITQAQAWALTEAFRAGHALHYKYVLLLLNAYRVWASGLPTLCEHTVPQGSRLTIVGDTHGQLEDLYTIFTLNGVPSPSNTYLMNGDFVDRGSKGCEVVLTLMAWCLAGVPEAAQGLPASASASAAPTPMPPCHIHRGNHESHAQNSAGGFLGEVLAKYTGAGASGGDKTVTSALNLYDTFQAAFECMPLATVVCAGTEGGGSSSHSPSSSSAGGSASPLAATSRRSISMVKTLKSITTAPAAGATAAAAAAAAAGAAVAAGVAGHPYLELPPAITSTAAAAAAAASGASSGRHAADPPPRIFVAHGGLFRDAAVNLSLIHAVPRQRDIPFGLPGTLDRVFEDIMWSDPLPGLRGCLPSDRGAGVKFGADVTRGFCERNALRCVVRSHEMVQEGCEWLHDGRLLTVFSASRYTGKGDNKGAVIVFNSALQYITKAFTALPLGRTHPMCWNAATMSLELHASVVPPGSSSGGGAQPAAHTPRHFASAAAAAAAAASFASAAAAAPPPPHAPSAQPTLSEAVRRMIVERIVLRKPDLHFFYAAEEAKAGKSSSGSGSGTITKATWAEGLRQVLGLDLPWLSLQPMLVALEAGSGRVNYSRFLDRYSIAMRSADTAWMEGIVDTVASRLLGAFGSLEDTFRSLDVDGSGGIDLPELAAALEGLSLGLSRAQVAALMDAMDTDRDGRVQFAEFKQRFVYTFAAMKDDEAGEERRRAAGSSGGGSSGSSGGGAGSSGGSSGGSSKGGLATAAPAAAGSAWVQEMCTLIGSRLFKGGSESPEAVFSSLDSNKNGLLSQAEFSAGIAAMGLKLSAADIRRFMEGIDTNASGDVNYKEVRRAHGTQAAALWLCQARNCLLSLSLTHTHTSLVPPPSPPFSVHCCLQAQGCHAAAHQDIGDCLGCPSPGPHYCAPRQPWRRRRRQQQWRRRSASSALWQLAAQRD